MWAAFGENYSGTVTYPCFLPYVSLWRVRSELLLAMLFVFADMGASSRSLVKDVSVYIFLYISR